MLKRHLKKTLCFVFLSCLSSAYADDACSVARISTLTDGTSCQNMMMDCAFYAMSHAANSNFADFITDFTNADSTTLKPCDKAGKQCTVVYDAGCATLTGGTQSTLWVKEKGMLTSVITALTTHPTQPSPYNSATLQCTYTCTQFDASGFCANPPPMSDWNCQEN